MQKKVTFLTDEVLPATQAILTSYKGDTPKCLLKYIGPMTNPRRIIIAISGFLSEGADESKGWAQLIEHANSKNIGTFNLQWRSITKSESKTGGIGSGENLFNKAKYEAKIAGKLLACALAARIPFFTHTVNFIGHSLGCQVIKSCLKQLRALKVGDLVENVTYLAGAASCFERNEKASAFWPDVLCSTVNGTIRNVHTPNDQIL